MARLFQKTVEWGRKLKLVRYFAAVRDECKTGGGKEWLETV